MMIPIYSIRIINPQLGDLLNEKFVNDIQFKLFLKMVNASLELKNDLTFFNGVDFLIHIPYNFLVSSVIITNVTSSDITSEIVKSKIEALVTK
jgi:hypothetical protein